MTFFTLSILIFSFLLINLAADAPEEKEGVKYASRCEGKSGTFARVYNIEKLVKQFNFFDQK